MSPLSDPAAFTPSGSANGMSDPKDFVSRVRRAVFSRVPDTPRQPEGGIVRPEEPLERDPAGDPVGLALSLLPAGRAVKVADAATEALPWLARAAARGAIAGGTAGAIDRAVPNPTLTNNPVVGAVAGAAGGAVLGPPTEALFGAPARIAAALRARGAAPVASAVEAGAADLAPAHVPPPEPVVVEGRPTPIPEPAAAPTAPPAAEAAATEGAAARAAAPDEATLLEPAPPVSVPVAEEAPALEGAAAAAPERTPAPPMGEAPPQAPNTGAVTVENKQQFPLIEDLRAQIKADPEYAKRIAALGGGREVANAETLARAMEAGPMPPDELAAWTADRPVDPVTQTRGLITFDYFQRQWDAAVSAGDEQTEREARAIVEQLLPGTENLRATSGRSLQAQGMFVRGEMGKALDSLHELRNSGMSLDEVRRQANDIVAAAKARAKVIGAGKTATHYIRMLETYATFVKFTSVVTHAVNTVSNALTFAIRPIEKFGAAAAYRAQGNAAAAEGEMSALFGTTIGFRNGLQRYLSVLMDDVADTGKIGEVTANKNIPLPKAMRPFDVFRQLSAADAFWKGVLRDARLHELAYTAARREGLSGEALAVKVHDYASNPPKVWSDAADEYAKEFTFQEDADRFLKSIEGIHNLPFVKLFMPVVKTPYNIGRFQFQRSAAGVVSPRNFGGLMAGGQKQAEAVGRLTAGLALSGGALALVASTEATGDYPKDPRERARWNAEHIPPYSIKVNGRWVNYSRFAPVGLYIGQAVALRDAVNGGDNEGAAAIAAQLMATSVKQMADMPFMTGLSDLLDAVKEPENRAPKFVGGVLSGLVPNALRDVRQQVDPVMRRQKSITDAVTNMIPGRSQFLPASIDVLGRERRYESNRALRAAKIFATPTPSAETELLDEARWFPSEPVPDLKPRGEPEVHLSGDEMEQFQREMGEATRSAIAGLNSPRFRAMAASKRQAAQDELDKAVNAARKQVRDRWKQKVTNRN